MKKISILVETDECHNQWLTTFDSWGEARNSMLERFHNLLEEDLSSFEREYDFGIHFNNAWMSREVSKDEFEHNWHIYELEV